MACGSWDGEDRPFTLDTRALLITQMPARDGIARWPILQRRTGSQRFIFHQLDQVQQIKSRGMVEVMEAGEFEVELYYQPVASRIWVPGSNFQIGMNPGASHRYWRRDDPPIRWYGENEARVEKLVILCERFQTYEYLWSDSYLNK